MAIKTMTLENLTVFEKATFEFVPGINVVLGTNSTGKTHALKWLYSGVKAYQKSKRDRSGESVLRPKLAGVFLPRGGYLRRLMRRDSDAKEGIMSIVADEGRVRYVQQRTGGCKSRGTWDSSTTALFLPSREVLSLFEGFVAAYEERELSIDETYYDACVALSASVLRGPRADEAEPLARLVGQLLGGKVALAGERFQVKFQGSRASLEAHLVAEGLRKIASLVRLLQNGSIAPGGLLIWDEPEANLNARLVAALVPILEALAKAGVQIVLATHDYLLAKRLSLISEVDSADRPSVKFFLLSRPAVGAPVEIASGATLADLPQTPMEAEFLKLYDDERRAYVGG